MPRTQLIGVVAPAPSGDYDASLSYQILNVVRYGNASYIATQNVPIGKSPENTDYWQVLCTDGQGGGTDDYEDLENKPSINGVELSGDVNFTEIKAIDATPTSGSSNLITSGGVYAVLGNVESLLAAL